MEKVKTTLCFCEECGKKTFIENKTASTGKPATFRCPACNYLNTVPEDKPHKPSAEKLS